MCAVSWPDDKKYAKCPQCDGPTNRFTNLEPMPEDEAESLVSHLKFERFYEAHCTARGVPVEGPLKDELAEMLPDLASLT